MLQFPPGILQAHACAFLWSRRRSVYNMCKERAMAKKNATKRDVGALTENDLCTLNDPSVIGGP